MVFLRLFERVFVVVLLLSSMGMVDAFTRASRAPGDPNVISTDVPLPVAIIEAAVYACGAILVLLRWRHVLRAANTVLPLLAYMMLAPLSIAWSVQPLLTFRRSALVIGSTFLGLYLGERYSMQKLARLLAEALCLLMLITVAFYFVAPGYVIDYYGSWKGLSGNKNAFGAYMAIAVLLLLVLRFQRFPWLRFLFIIVAAVLLVLSHSISALAWCLLFAAAIPFLAMSRRIRKWRWVAYTVLIVAMSLVTYFMIGRADLVFRFLGRDSTFSGRTQLWAAVLDAIAKHPILGYGYDAFWGTLQGETLDFWTRTRWFAMGTDNGYLELCLSFGVLGFAVFAYVFVYSLRMALGYMRAEPDRIAIWPATYLLFFALHNVFESQLLTTRSLEFLMFAAITTALAMQHRRAEAADTGSLTAEDWYISRKLATAPGSPPFLGYRFSDRHLCGDRNRI